MSWRSNLSFYIGPTRTARLGSSDNKTLQALDDYLDLLDLQRQSWALVFWIELPLRNLIHEALQETFGERWWQSPVFQNCVGSNLSKEVLSSKWAFDASKIFLDDLSFGVWVKCLSPAQEKHLWTPILCQRFTPGVSRKKLHNQLLAFKKYRNAIAHHEHRSAQQLEHMRQLALEIAACIDSHLPELLRYVLSRAA
jgi:hypothetical protein